MINFKLHERLTVSLIRYSGGVNVEFKFEHPDGTYYNKLFKDIVWEDLEEVIIYARTRDLPGVGFHKYFEFNDAEQTGEPDYFTATIEPHESTMKLYFNLGYYPTISAANSEYDAQMDKIIEDYTIEVHYWDFTKIAQTYFDLAKGVM